MNEQKTFIIGSISQEEQIKNLADKFNTTMYVKHQPNKSFKQLVSEAFTNIEEADLIIAVKKPDGTFGEGTTYELEYARRLGKRIQTEDIIPLNHKRKRKRLNIDAYDIFYNMIMSGGVSVLIILVIYTIMDILSSVLINK